MSDERRYQMSFRRGGYLIILMPGDIDNIDAGDVLEYTELVRRQMQRIIDAGPITSTPEPTP